MTSTSTLPISDRKGLPSRTMPATRMAPDRGSTARLKRDPLPFTVTDSLDSTSLHPHPPCPRLCLHRSHCYLPYVMCGRVCWRLTLVDRPEGSLLARRSRRKEGRGATQPRASGGCRALPRREAFQHPTPPSRIPPRSPGPTSRTARGRSAPPSPPPPRPCLPAILTRAAAGGVPSQEYVPALRSRRTSACEARFAGVADRRLAAVLGKGQLQGLGVWGAR